MKAARAHSGGYVMLLVAAVIALLAFVLLEAARAQSDLSLALRAQLADVERERTAQSLAGRVGFVLLTEPIGPRSVVVGGVREGGQADDGLMNAAGGRVRELRLDGRYYVASGRNGVLVSVQDESGLLDMNAGDDAALAALLEQAGASAASARRLAAAVGDYVDGDDLARLDGAESDAYRRARLPEPPNRNMVNRWSAQGAFGWEGALSPEQRSEIWRNTGAAPSPAPLNVNTAPFAVLQAVLGDARMARAVAARRERQELRSLNDVEALTGANTRASGVVLAAQPGSAFRLVVAFEAQGAARLESQLVLAGAEADRPIYWREARRDDGRVGRDRENDAESLPESAALLAP